MTRPPSRRLRRSAVVLASLGLAAVALPLAANASTSRATGAAHSAAAAALPSAFVPAAVTSPPGACATSYDLYAKSGTMTTLPGLASLPILGYTAGSADVLTAPGGPTLVACAGTPVAITLHNGLTTETTALLFDGQPMVPDTTGISPTDPPKTYTLAVAQPGTYLYEAGLTANAEHQAAMGLYGALVVRPAAPTTPPQAYDAATTAFDDEAVVLTSEIDPALNNAANPAAFDMRTFSPKYSLINGQAYPVTTTIPTGAGRRVLLRYLNAGTQPHSMGVLGLNETLVATDGSPYTDARHVVAETFGPGQTADAIATIPAAATTGSRYALYDASLSLNNNTATGLGGALTFLGVGAPTVSSPTSVVNSIATTAGPVTITGFNGTVTGGATLSARYYVDSVVGAGTPVSPAPASGVAFDVTLAAAITSAGVHTIYLQGSEDAGVTWGPIGQLSFTIPPPTVTDIQPPTTSSLTLSPNPSNGTVAVTLSALASDVGTGGSDIVSAAYTIDGGSPVAITVTKSGPGTANLLATIPAGLTPGNHTVSVTSKDLANNTSAAVIATLVIDNLGPATSGVTATPAATNGTTSVRIAATITDVASNVAIAEGFIDTVGPNGTGFVFTPADGLFNSPTEALYADIPQTTVNLLAAGNHSIYVHGKDALGNWGATASVVLTIDKVPPTVGVVTLTPAAANAQAVAISAPATDALTNIAGGEFFIDTVGGNGTGGTLVATAPALSTTVTGTIPGATVGGLAAGNHTVYVHAKDAAGNWGPTSSATLLIDRTAPTFTGITLAPTPTNGATTVVLTVNGAADTGAGVAGGEYWINPPTATAPAPGSGTPFTGLTASIPVGTLATGTYTVSARIRDAAGNWSTGFGGIRTATLTVVPDAIFADGFESPSTLPGNWSSASTATVSRLNNTTTAALVGSRGLQAQGNNTNYVQYNFGTAANPATPTFDARFYFNPNGNTGTNQDIFVARTTGGSTVFRVRYRWNGGSPQVQIQVGTGTANVAWTGITNGVGNRIEVVWQSGSTLQLYVGGTPSQSLTANTNSVGQVRLGSVTSGGSNILEYFDAFSAKRTVTPLIGP